MEKIEINNTIIEKVEKEYQQYKSQLLTQQRDMLHQIIQSK